ncbi:hypothetical protein XELAEV_18002386mg [Xenopus laevis]|uniref:Uncharacterized protein n=1 Tax=Xenopus laevis TaxID=8355 RepID=A0A974GYD9_XENLA|nr:hypothetical protein XELAEV_18002386mg [Xenopus laevis]
MLIKAVEDRVDEVSNKVKTHDQLIADLQKQLAELHDRMEDSENRSRRIRGWKSPTNPKAFAVLHGHSWSSFLMDDTP